MVKAITNANKPRDFLKVLQSSTFKKSLGLGLSAKRCNSPKAFIP